jgi:hypothetical protein
MVIPISGRSDIRGVALFCGGYCWDFVRKCRRKKILFLLPI